MRQKSNVRRSRLLLSLAAIILVGCVSTTQTNQGNGYSNQGSSSQNGGSANQQPANVLPPSSGNAVQGSNNGQLPQLQTKPRPVSVNFEGCPAGGDGGDHQLNMLKNRTDTVPWYPVSVASILNLQWPQTIQQRQRQTWSQADAAAIARYEGTPVQIEGYLAGAKQQGPESTNCHAVDQVDNHIWVVDDPSKDRSKSVVVEITPRTRALHPGWAFSRISPLVDHRTKVRISGWLLMDQEHPDQIGKTRGTIWEIHPVVAFDVLQGNRWVSLDTGNAVPQSTNDQALVPTDDPSLPPPIVDPKDQEANQATPVPTRRSGTAAGQPLHTGPIAIVDIFYRAINTQTQSDEYVEIENTGDSPVNMSGWSLHNVYGSQTFSWSNFTLAAQKRIRVYTNEQHPESGGFSFKAARGVWNNSGGAAELVDANSVIVAVYGYGNKR